MINLYFVIKLYASLDAENKFKFSYLDSNNILWKIRDKEIIGKRAVQTRDLSIVWLEETSVNNIKSFLCDVDTDYKEVFIINL